MATRKTNDVQRLVFKMLTENTGRSLGDSGGAYGRNHERNAKKKIQDFLKEEEETYTFDYKYGWINRNVSLFHYMCGLELDDICEKFNRRNNSEDNWDGNDFKELEDCYGVSTRAGSWLIENHEIEVKHTFNTYNGDSDLSQILQGSSLEIDGDSYYLLQVHGGCDARGGYTNAKLFKTSHYSEGIHEYLWEYKCSSEIMYDLNEGYIEGMNDDGDSTIYHDRVTILDRIKEIEDEKHNKKVMQQLVDEFTKIKNS